MQTIVVNQINADELKSAVTDITRELLLTSCASVKVSTQTVCEIWGITPQTLTRYVKEGIIEVVGKNGRIYVYKYFLLRSISKKVFLFFVSHFNTLLMHRWLYLIQEK